MEVASTSTNDVFLSGGVNKRDWSYVLSAFILLGLLFIFNSIQSNNLKSYGNIYLPIFTFTLVLVLVALVTKNMLVREVIFGKIKDRSDLVKNIGIGVVFGVVLVSSVVVPLTFFKILLPPLSFVNTGISDVLLSLFVVAFIAPEVEEMFRASVLVPTLSSAMKNEALFASLMFVGAMLFIFLVQEFVVAFVFIALAMLFLFSQKFRDIIRRNPKTTHLVGIVVSAFVFSVYHIYAYGGSSDLISLFFSIGVFAIVADSLNWFAQNTIISRLGHSINNAVIYCTLSGISLITGFFIVGLYILMIYTVYVASLGGRNVRID